MTSHLATPVHSMTNERLWTRFMCEVRAQVFEVWWPMPRNAMAVTWLIDKIVYIKAWFKEPHSQGLAIEETCWIHKIQERYRCVYTWWLQALWLLTIIKKNLRSREEGKKKEESVAHCLPLGAVWKLCSAYGQRLRASMHHCFPRVFTLSHRGTQWYEMILRDSQFFE